MRPELAFIGCGRVARALAPLLQERGWPVVGVASRNADSAQDLACRLGDAGLACSPQDAVERAQLVWMTVPDDAIEPTVKALSWRPGVGVVHCSGATEVEVLCSARAAGAWVGGFHPLQIFSDPDLAAQRLAGASVAVEADEPALERVLLALAQSLGLNVLRLPPGGRARYHAAAGHAASGLLSVLAEAAVLWRTLGWDEGETLRALLPLSQGALASAQNRGLGASVAGPVARGDVSVVHRQRTDLSALGEASVAFYDSLALRQCDLLEAAGRLDVRTLQRLRSVLLSPAKRPQGSDGDG